MTTPNLATLTDAIRGPFRRFTEEFEPLRPELYRYCRYLTHTPWDAEDLVQDTLVRAFMILATLHSPPTHAKAWLFRVASNRWLNLCKQRREIPESELPESAADPHDVQGTREAASTLVTALAPQERAALVLKEMFDFSLEETASTLSTSVGAVKSALHRARGKVKEPLGLEHSVVVPRVLEQFCTAFNQRDLEKVLSLLLDDVQIELSGTFVESGVEVAKRSFGGLLFATQMAMNAGIAAPYRGNIEATAPRFELHTYREQPVVLTMWSHADGEHVRGVSRFALIHDAIAGIKTYMHSPELIAEVAGELGLSFRSNGYRNWESVTGS